MEDVIPLLIKGSAGSRVFFDAVARPIIDDIVSVL